MRIFLFKHLNIFIFYFTQYVYQKKILWQSNFQSFPKGFKHTLLKKVPQKMVLGGIYNSSGIGNFLYDNRIIIGAVVVTVLIIIVLWYTWPLFPGDNSSEIVEKVIDKVEIVEIIDIPVYPQVNYDTPVLNDFFNVFLEKIQEAIEYLHYTPVEDLCKDTCFKNYLEPIYDAFVDYFNTCIELASTSGLDFSGYLWVFSMDCQEMYRDIMRAEFGKVLFHWPGEEFIYRLTFYGSDYAHDVCPKIFEVMERFYCILFVTEFPDVWRMYI